MKMVRGDVEGDLLVDRGTKFLGAISGEVTVTGSAWIEIHGAVGGSVTVQAEASAQVFGSVAGDVHAWGFASIDGDIGGVVYRHPGGQLFVGTDASLRSGAVDAR